MLSVVADAEEGSVAVVIMDDAVGRESVQKLSIRDLMACGNSAMYNT